MGYSTILSAIGQKLESLRPSAYEIVCYGNSYLVRCRVKEGRASAKENEKKVRKLPSFLRLWREEERPPGQAAEEETFMTVEFFYYLDDIERQVDERPPPLSGPDTLPDPYSFSYTLSVVGEFVDRKPNARLLFASNRGHEGQEIVILYETEPGTRRLEEFPIAGLYDLWVQQYVKKKK
jgi:hypothetical protein